MNKFSHENGIGFLVIIIPTKESVFSPLIEGNETLQASDKIDRLISNERSVSSIVMRYFDEHGIEYIDLLPSLQEAAYTEQIYPANFGGHTNKNGYRIIVETVSGWLVEPTGD